VKLRQGIEALLRDYADDVPGPEIYCDLIRDLRHTLTDCRDDEPRPGGGSRYTVPGKCGSIWCLCARGGECMTAKYGVPSVGTPQQTSELPPTTSGQAPDSGPSGSPAGTANAAAPSPGVVPESRGAISHTCPYGSPGFFPNCNACVIEMNRSMGKSMSFGWACSSEASPWTEHERCSDCGEGHMSGCPKHEAAPRCRWSSRIGYDCELSEGHEGGHQATDLDGVSKVGWGSNHRAAYQRHCPSPADELTTEAEKLGMYWTNDARANDTSSPKSITTTAGVIPKCHFCDRPSTEVTWMVATDDTPSRAACNECIAACSEAVRIREAQRPDNPLPHAVTLTMGGSRTLAINDGRCIVTLMWNGEASMKSITETGQALVDNLKPRSDRAIHVPKTGEQTFWYEAGLEAGLARPCACEGVLRSETPLLADKASYALGWNAAVEQAAKTAEATQPVVSGYGGTSPSDYKTFYEPNPYAACCAANIRKLKTSPTGSEGDRG
jgi:hypothetical protein